ncbi:acetylcholinesterase-like isoform X2 [Dermacentor albipictus]|uniref:acetylcholinesterase-like isoform X2 n=1 Tax=Dermacentor albipictus TaxID=60249 RepID=UPI0031FDFB43
MERQEPDRSTATSVQGSKKSKRRRASQKPSSNEMPNAEVAVTDKAADLNRPASERSMTCTALERSGVKKGRRSKKLRSISSASRETAKLEVTQQPSSTSLESGTLSSTPVPPQPTLTKHQTEAHKMATKPTAATDAAPVPPPQPGAGMVAVEAKEEAHAQAAAPANPNEPDDIGLFQPLHEGNGRKGPPLRFPAVGDDSKMSLRADHRCPLFVAAVLSVFVFNALAVLWLLMRTWEDEEMHIEVPGLGICRGLRTSVENRPVYMFRGIPFARSPEGPLRFADASKVSDDNYGEIDARIPKPGCAQKAYTAKGQVIRSNEHTSEDCLHLNVWTPCTEHSTPGCRKTVLVFFHAIEFQNGDNNYYDGRWLAGLGDLVVVAPNFRLGAFGFLNIDCLVGGDIPCTPSDVGLGDQHVAVQWVLDRIASFGGNASDVVLMGSGSGAWSVGAHLLQGETTGPRFWSHERFAKVILMSESPFRRYFDDKSHELPALLNCSHGGVVGKTHCLRVIPSREIVRVTGELGHYFGPSGRAHPTVEDALRVTGRRFLLGTVSNEGTHLFDYLKRTSPPDAGMDLVVPTFLNTIYHIRNAGEVVDTFRKATTPIYKATASVNSWALDLLGDFLYTCPLLKFGHELAASQRNQVFGYVFDHKASFALFNDTTGAARFMDLDFVFGRPLEGSRAATAQERDLSRRMIDIWSTFAKTGNLPFVHGQPWTSYRDDGRDIGVRIGLTTLEEVRDYRKKTCAILPSLAADPAALKGGAAVALQRESTSRKGGAVTDPAYVRTDISIST